MPVCEAAVCEAYLVPDDRAGLPIDLLWSAAIPVPTDATLRWFSDASGYLLPVLHALDALGVQLPDAQLPDALRKMPDALRKIAAHVKAQLRAVEAPSLPRRSKFLAEVLSALRAEVAGSPTSVPRSMQVSDAPTKNTHQARVLCGWALEQTHAVMIYVNLPMCRGSGVLGPVW